MPGTGVRVQCGRHSRSVEHREMSWDIVGYRAKSLGYRGMHRDTLVYRGMQWQFDGINLVSPKSENLYYGSLYSIFSTK